MLGVFSRSALRMFLRPRPEPVIHQPEALLELAHEHGIQHGAEGTLRVMGAGCDYGSDSIGYWMCPARRADRKPDRRRTVHSSIGCRLSQQSRAALAHPPFAPGRWYIGLELTVYRGALLEIRKVHFPDRFARIGWIAAADDETIGDRNSYVEHYERLQESLCNQAQKEMASLV